jgi:hypothetical protein
MTPLPLAIIAYLTIIQAQPLNTSCPNSVPHFDPDLILTTTNANTPPSLLHDTTNAAQDQPPWLSAATFTLLCYDIFLITTLGWYCWMKKSRRRIGVTGLPRDVEMRVLARSVRGGRGERGTGLVNVGGGGERFGREGRDTRLEDRMRRLGLI